MIQLVSNLSLRKTLLLCAGYGVVLTLTACGHDNSDADNGPQAVARGERVFIVNCGPCHGPEGRGPALADIKALSPAERSEMIRNHPMAGQIPQRLPANELHDVIRFIESE